MDIKQFNNALSNYNRTLTQINESDFFYTVIIKNATEIFFEEIKEIDNKLIHYYLENLDKKNIKNNENQVVALKHFLMCTIQSYKQPEDFMFVMFPEYVENITLKSTWWIIRLFKFFISFFLKPKLIFLNLPDTEKIKNTVKRIQQINKEKNKEFYDALDTIFSKFLEKTNLISDEYLPLDENNLCEQWDNYKKKPCYRLKEVKVDEHYPLDMDILLDYLSKRISLLIDSKEKRYLSFAFAALRDYVYKLDIISFKKKFEEIENYLKQNFNNEHQEKIKGILNLIEKIMQRMQILNKALFKVNFYSTNDERNEEMDYLKFCYEQHKAHWEKSYRNGENTANYYEFLNSLENLLYDAIFILDRNKLAENLRFNDIAIILQDKENISENSTGIEPLKSEKMLIKNLDLRLTKLRNHTTQLRNFTKMIVLNGLADDMFKLIEHIEGVIQILNEEIHEANRASPSLDLEFEQSEELASLDCKLSDNKACKNEIQHSSFTKHSFFNEAIKKGALAEKYSVSASL